MIGSVVGGLIGQAGAQQGGQMAYNAAQSGATTASNIMNDQRKDNRVAASPYMATGRFALNEIGRLLGWGQLETQGGHDDWRWSTDAYGGSQAQKPPAGSPAGGYWMGDARTPGAGVPGANGLTYGGGGGDPSNILRLAGVVQTPDLVGSFPRFDRIKVSDTFEADPGYAFRQSEGQKALERSASARGKTLSGEQFKALSDFNSGLASQEYGNWWSRYTGGTQFNNAASQQEFANSQGAKQQDYQNRYGAYQNVLNLLTGLAGFGQGATSSLTGANSGLASSTGNAFTSAGISGGQALGQGYAQGANALASGVGSGINNALAGAYMGWGGSNPIFGSRSGRSSYPTTNETMKIALG